MNDETNDNCKTYILQNITEEDYAVIYNVYFFATIHCYWIQNLTMFALFFLYYYFF